MHGLSARQAPLLLSRLRAPILCLGLFYLALGIYLYLTHIHGDLWWRWLEKMYVLAGIDPLSSDANVRGAQAHLSALAPTAGYAPWSYLYAALFAPGSDFALAADVFLALNLAAFGYLVYFGYSQGANFGAGRAVAQLSAGATVAFLAVPMALWFANYGLITTALLAGMIQCLERRRGVAAGVCLGLAMVKPQIAALFFVVPAVRSNWLTVGVAAALVVGAWEAAALLTDTAPMTLLLEMLGRGSQFADAYQGVFAGVAAFGVPARVATAIGLALGVSITAALCWRVRSQALVTLAAIPAVMSTIWTYHRAHDLVVLAFLGLAAVRYIAQFAVRHSGSGPPHWQLALLATVYVPYMNRLAAGYAVPTLIRALWFAALLTVLTGERRPAQSGLGTATTAAS